MKGDRIPTCFVELQLLKIKKNTNKEPIYTSAVLLVFLPAREKTHTLYCNINISIIPNINILTNSI